MSNLDIVDKYKPHVPTVGGALGDGWGIKSTARFYEDLLTAWADGRFGNAILGRMGKEGRVLAPFIQKKVKQTYWTRGTHTAAWATIYGAKTFAQLMYDAPLWGLPRKVNWINAGSGWRVVSADVTTLVTGVGETEGIPNEDVPTLNEVECIPKILCTSFGMYDLMQVQSRLGNDAIPIEEFARQYYRDAHVKGINNALGTVVDTVAGNSIESYDRITSSYAEQNVTDNAPDTNDANLSGYLIDGSAHNREAAAGWTDAQLVHNNGTDRELELAHMNELARKCRKAGLKNGVWVTNWEVAEKINALIEPKQRYVGVNRRVFTINGVQTPAGEETGFEVASYLNMPIIVTDAIVDTTDEGARIYLIDLDNLFIKVALPTMYLTTEDADKLVIGYFRTDAMYVTMAELVCTKFYSQGKIRDINV